MIKKKKCNNIKQHHNDDDGGGGGGDDDNNNNNNNNKYTRGSTYKVRDFSRRCPITTVVCNCPHTSDTQTGNS